jgi:hypothetical protein
MEVKLQLKRQIHSLYEQLQYAPIETSISAILVKLRVSRLLWSWGKTITFPWTPLSAGDPAANQGDLRM